MDSDGIVDEPLWVRLALEVNGSELSLRLLAVAARRAADR